jgi:putative inorganic carbon (HCO3(-)) transporter
MIFPIGRWPFLVLGLVALTWLCRWLATGRFTVATGMDVPIVIILFMALVGYSISIVPALSETRLWSLIFGIAVFYGIVNTLNLERYIWAAASFLAVLTVGIAGISLLGTDWQQTRMVKLPWIYDHLPSLIRGLPNSGVPRASDLIHPRFVGITMAVLVAVFLALFIYTRNRNLRILSLVVILVGFGTLLLTQTLAGVVGVLVALLFLAVWRNRWFLLAIPMGLAAGLTGLLVIGPTRFFQYIFSVDNPVGIGVALRMDIWSRALAMIRDMPYTGIGVNTFPVILSSFYPGFLLGPEPHAHNLFLQTALDFGLPGLVAFLWLVVAWVVMVRRKYRVTQNQEYRILMVGLIAGMLAYVVHGFMDAMMLGAKPGVVIWILMGIGAAPLKSLNPTECAVAVKPKNYLRRFSLIAMIIVFLLAITVFKPASVYMNIGAIQAHRALYSADPPGSVETYTMNKAKQVLIKVIDINPGYLSAYELLGRVYAWEGNPTNAMQAFAHRVALDEDDPLLKYFPTARWLRQMQGADSDKLSYWEDLITVYSQWMQRFPDRAEVYSEIGLVWQCYFDNANQSEVVLRSGIENQAHPLKLLEYYQGLLSQGDYSVCLK